MSELTSDLMEFCKGLLRANLIGTDVADVTVERVARDFPQDSTGVRVSFTVSDQFIGKTDEVTLDALERLLDRS